MAVEFQRVVPILRIFGIEKAKEFYVDYLGFKIDWEHRYEEICRFTCRCRAATWCYTSASITATAAPVRTSAWR